jgi:hypothetical protein
MWSQGSMRHQLPVAIVPDQRLAERRQRGAAARLAAELGGDHGLAKGVRVDQQPGARYDMSMARPAAEIEPVSRRYSSNRILPGRWRRPCRNRCAV